MSRPFTPDRKNPDGSTTITVKRACNGCGELIGDVTDAETERAVAGQPLLDVRHECPRCAPAPTPLTAERLAEIETRAKNATQWPCPADSEWVAKVAEDLTLLLAEVDRLRERDASVHLELRDRRTDDLEVRGHLSPQPGTGPVPMLPFPLGKTIAPAVEWLVATVVSLREALDEAGALAVSTAAVNDKLHTDLREADKVISDYDDARQVAVKERDLFRDAAMAQTAALQRYVETLEGHALDAGQSMDERDAGRSVAYAEASAGLSRLLNGLRP